MRILSNIDKVKYAVFAAEQVIDIYEKEYPADDRQRKAIESAKAYVANPNKENAYDIVVTAAGDAYASYAVAYVNSQIGIYTAYNYFAITNATYAAYAAYASANAAVYASAADAGFAANAAANAAYTADTAYVADADTYHAGEMKIKIIRYGVKLKNEEEK